MAYINVLQLKTLAEPFGFSLTEHELSQFDRYASFLVEYNQKVNLTSITNPADIVIKHFLDSLLLLAAADIPQGASLVDVGTGAGFPGVPVKIVRPDIQLTLMDSLNKRLVFLTQLGEKLGLSWNCVHLRAEDAGRDKAHREKYDVVTARAVADLAALCEYCLPLTKVGGTFAALKGPGCQPEVAAAQTAITLLGGKVTEIKEYQLPGENGRSIVLIQKTSQTPTKYPRAATKIAKNPL